MTTPTSCIMNHHVEVNQPEGSSMVILKDLLEEPHIQPGIMQSALSAVTSLFTPNKSTQPTASNDPIVPHKVPVHSAPNDTDTPVINRELNIYRDRLEKQSKIKVECAKQSLKSEFDHELRHQTMTQTEAINSVRQQIDQLGVQL